MAFARGNLFLEVLPSESRGEAGTGSEETSVNYLSPAISGWAKGGLVKVLHEVYLFAHRVDIVAMGESWESNQ